MRAVIQRVSRAAVTVDQQQVGSIGQGLVVLLPLVPMRRMGTLLGIRCIQFHINHSSGQTEINSVIKPLSCFYVAACSMGTRKKTKKTGYRPSRVSMDGNPFRVLPEVSVLIF
jgi:D-Tyr-tRNAtyr deacylase